MTRETDSLDASTPVEELRNLGAISGRWLREAGVATRADLERLGSVGAFAAVRDQGHAPSLNLLWALEAALLDVDWRELPAGLKERLRDGVRRLERSERT